MYLMFINGETMRVRDHDDSDPLLWTVDRAVLGTSVAVHANLTPLARLAGQVIRTAALSTDVQSADTTITVASIAGFPQDPDNDPALQFVIRIDSTASQSPELLRVLDMSDLDPRQWLVERGVGGTITGPHDASNSRVSLAGLITIGSEFPGSHRHGIDALWPDSAMNRFAPILNSFADGYLGTVAFGVSSVDEHSVQPSMPTFLTVAAMKSPTLVVHENATAILGKPLPSTMTAADAASIPQNLMPPGWESNGLRLVVPALVR
jgi:hypothetical protein